MREQTQNCFHKCAELAKTFSRDENFSEHVQNTNVQMCKCAKTVCAQNAQICSANFFPNAEITNLHCAQKHKCNFLHMSQFCRVNNFLNSDLCLCRKSFYVEILF